MRGLDDKLQSQIRLRDVLGDIPLWADSDFSWVKWDGNGLGVGSDHGRYGFGFILDFLDLVQRTLPKQELCPKVAYHVLLGCKTS